jgi:2,4-dienoyl-CoA reductase-like NADH-dependent reductase (Old Yellow Enzyme family)
MRADVDLVPERVAPWADPDRNVVALSTVQVKQVIEDFVAAAVRVQEAGFDGVQLHAAHGYLLGQFLDSRYNDRSDGYGATPAGRARIILEIMSGARRATSEAFQIGVRFSPERWGIKPVEATWLAQLLLQSDEIDYVDVSLWDVEKLPEGSGAGSTLINTFTSMERGSTRLGVSGKILSAPRAQWCLDSGADFAGVGTAAIVHHDFAAQIMRDPDFTTASFPVSQEHLEDEGVSEAFRDYLREVRPSLMARANEGAPS